MVKSPTEAEEILQEVFLKIWHHRESINPEKSFRSYLFKIAENKVFDFFRKAARDKEKTALLMEMGSSEYLPEHLLSRNENLLLLEKAIGSLSPQRQLVFRLCKLEDKSYKEVSALLNISVSTISDHIVKATRAIRSYFENNDEALPVLFVVACLAAR